MKKKAILLMLTGIILVLAIIALPTSILAGPVLPICQPWVYSHSYLKCVDGNTFIVDVYKRVCPDGLEFRSDVQLYVTGFCLESNLDTK